MKRNLLLACAGVAGALCLGSREASAQGGGNFDPTQIQQQMQQRAMENYRTQMEITNDVEWQVIQPRIQKVLDAKQEAGVGVGLAGNLGNILGAFGGGQRGGQGGQGGTRTGVAGRLGATRGTDTGPEADAVQKAVEAGASNDELKAALAKLAEARKLKQANLEKAQAELRQILSIRREAIATLAGLL